MLTSRDQDLSFANVKTVADAVAAVAAAFRKAGLATPDVDARLLVAGATDLCREQMIKEPEKVLSAAEKDLLDGFCRRRLDREPVSRILGYRAFYGRRFEISPQTLDPRPETEVLVDCVLSYVDEIGHRDDVFRILDVGTGSGAILITLLCELRQAIGVGTDICDRALAVAKSNADRLGVADRSEFQSGNGTSAVHGPFDILVSNPPYIERSDIARLAPEVRNFDPRIALDGGADGLDFYRSFATSIENLVPNGLAVFEVGHNQSSEVVNIFASQHHRHGNVQITTVKDLAGHQRCVALRTHSNSRTES